ILGVYLTMKLRAFSIGKLSISFNTMIYIACALLFDVQIAIYSVIYSYFMSQMVDKIHFQNIKMSVTVFTKKPLIDKALTHGLHRGVTYWKGNGGYTDENTFVIMTIVSKQEVNKLKEIVHQHDPNAFVIFNEGLNIDGNFEKRLA
ncbi:YitT family protein, partial [Anaerorhabdus sp.]|uniref:YitT family protein n=1 Tax=Anaerorhabdus sp. TaxID=1872524 RepID=UPI002FC788B8